MERRAILPISSGTINAGGIRTLALIAITLCLACSPVTLNSSAEDGNTSSDANTPGADAGESCQGSDDSCEGDTYRRCNNVGVFEDTVCELGCSSDGGAHCRQLHTALLRIPINMSCGMADDFSPSTDVLFDTATGAIINLVDQTPIRAAGMGLDGTTGIGFQTFSQGNATEVGIFTFGNLTLPQGNHQVRGPRAAAFIACGRIAVHGLIDATADRIRPGPGGHPPTNAPGPNAGGPGAGGDGQQDPNGNPGGGGGAFGGAGGGGGPGAISTGGDRGIPYGNASALPLVGGSSGGVSGGGNVGGAGGGAIYLASASAILFSGDGTINAGGGGGSTGSLVSGGGGGGAGGTIFLDAPVIALVGGATLAVNGGGGAIADAQQSIIGQNGSAGQGEAGPIRGGANLSSSGDNGGNGGAGGGGGCGRMRFVSASGAVDFSDTAMSPRPEVMNAAGEPIVSQSIADIK